MARALEGSELLFLLPARQKPLSALLQSYPPKTNTQKSMLLCRAEEKHTRPRIAIGPSGMMGGRDANSSCSEFPKQSMRACYILLPTNAQEED
jgi:hypothetical protein